MSSVLEDLRFGWRMFVRSPGFTLVALATLALGVGLNCAIFSVVNSILLRPLPYRDSERLVQIDETHPRLGIDDPGVSAANFLDWRAQNRVFEEMALIQPTAMNVTGGGGGPERIRGAEISASLFPLLRTWPAVGRAFGNEENVPGAARSVVLSWRLWQRRFGGSPSALGRTVVLSGRPYTVAGVMPPSLAFPEPLTDAWVPIEPDMRNRGSRGTAALAILRPGVSPGRAQTELQAIQQRLAAQYPESAGWQVKVSPARDQMVGAVRKPLLVLMGAAAFVLLIACANVANLLLARAPARRREVAVRTALGASRGRIVRQLMIESVLLGGLGGLVGVAAGRAALSLLVARLPEGIARAHEIGMDAQALAFTLAIAVLTGLVFGAAPALEASHPDLASALKQAGRGGGSRRHRLRSVLIVGEVALSLMLLVGVVLLAQSLFRLKHTDPGFTAEHVVTMRVDLPSTVYTDTARRTAFFTQVLEKVAGIPHVQAAGVSDAVPFRMGSGWGIAIEGRPPLKPGEFNMAGVSRVSPGYLRAMGIRLLRGRGLTDADREGSPLVAVITETMAKRYWPNEEPIGKRYRPAGPKTPWFTVVGVAADVKHWNIGRPAAPETFLSYLQDAPTDMALVLRTPGDPAAAAAEARRAVIAVDPNQPVGRVETMTAIIGESLAPQRVSAALAGIFGALALGLALVGIYGVVACSVTERTRKIGIRMALGANPAGVRGMVLRQALVLVAAGMVLGAAGALALTRLLGSTLYEVRATDPAAFSAAALAVLAAGLAAAWIPARRAAALAPSLALRHE